MGLWVSGINYFWSIMPRRIDDWMVAAGIAILTAAGVWGAMRSTIGNHEARISNLESWQGTVIQQVGNIDGKLDVLLNYHGLTYTPSEHDSPRNK